MRVAPSFCHTLSTCVGRLRLLAALGLFFAMLAAGALYAASSTTLVVTLSPASVVEGGAVSVDVSLTDPVLEGPVVVSLVTSDGPAGANGATAPADYAATIQTLTFAPGETTRTVSIATVGDTLDELNEVFDITATVTSAPGGVTIDGSPRLGVVVIRDDDSQDLVSFTGPAAVAESAGSASFTLTLSGATAQAVRVDYTVSAGSTNPAASPGTDTAASSGTWYIPAGASSATVSLGITDDALDEADEFFTVSIADVSGVNNPAFATTLAVANIAITDDDGPPALAVDSPSIAEGTGGGTNLDFTVSLAAASARTVTVDYATSNGTASAPSDYTAASGTLSFAPGETSKTVSVAVAADATAEDDETLILTLTNPTNATLGTATGTGTLQDDDTSPELAIGDTSVAEGDTSATIQVTLSQPSGRSITVNYATADGTASAPGDYLAASGTLTFAPGETSKTIAVMVKGDSAYEGDETALVNLSAPTNATIADGSATLTIEDDDRPTVTFDLTTSSAAEPNGSATVSLSLSDAVLPGDSVTVPFTIGGTATGSDVSVAPTSQVSFGPGETSKTIVVTVADDTLDEDPETIILTLGTTASAVLGAQTTHTVTIDDDDAEPEVRFASANSSTSEGAGAVTVLVELGAASGKTVTVDYSVADGTATAGDYSATSAGTLSLAPGQTSRTINVSPTDDTISETSETVLLALANPSAASLGLAAHTLRIDDNDGPPQVLFDTASSSVAESGGTATIDVVLTRAAGSNVSVDVAVAGGSAVSPSDYSFTPATVTFAHGETRKSVSVSVAANSAYQLDRTVVLDLGNLATSVPGVTIGANAQHTLTLEDDDGPAVTFAQATASAAENAGTHAVTVALSQAILAGDSATVTLTRGGTATSPADYTAPTTLVFAAGEQSKNFDIMLIDNGRDAPDKTVALSLGVAGTSNLALGNPSSFTLTIADDDESPVAASDAFSTAEDTALVLAAPGVLANDSDGDGDALSAVVVNNPSHGTLTLDANGALSYTPAADYNGTDTFSYKLRDPGGNESGAATITLTITPVNDAPVAVADTYATPEGTALIVSAPGVLANDRDVDGDALVAEKLSDPAHGTLTLDANGALSYTPAASFNGQDSFSYRVTDGTLASTPVTVTLRVGRAYVVVAPIAYGLPGVPDLVGNFALTPARTSFSSTQEVLVTMTVTNTGTGPTASGFWVDLYINPARVPNSANVRWETNCGIEPCRGLAWYVDRILAPGESVTLTSRNGSFVEESSRWDGRLPAGARSIYIYVDSWNPTVATGAVRELDEQNNLFSRTDLVVFGVAAMPKARSAAGVPIRPAAPR